MEFAIYRKSMLKKFETENQWAYITTNIQACL